MTVGTAPRITLSTRLIGTTLRVWLFERLLVDVELADQHITPMPVPRRPALPGPLVPGARPGVASNLPGATLRTVKIPLARTGRIGWEATMGHPVLRLAEVRDPALLRIHFTTSAHESFSDLLATTAADPTPLGPTTGHTISTFTNGIAAATETQRTLATAVVAQMGEQARYATLEVYREDLEQAKQAYVEARSAHDLALTALLAPFGSPHLVPVVTPTARRLQSVEGAWLAFLLQSPEPLDPQMAAFPGSMPFETVGRTTFGLRTAESAGDDAVPTSWLSSADGTTVLIYRADGTATLTEQAYELSATFVRDHADDQVEGADHRYDRPYLLARGSRLPESVTGIALPT